MTRFNIVLSVALFAMLGCSDDTTNTNTSMRGGSDATVEQDASNQMQNDAHVTTHQDGAVGEDAQVRDATIGEDAAHMDQDASMTMDASVQVDAQVQADAEVSCQQVCLSPTSGKMYCAGDMESRHCEPAGGWLVCTCHANGTWTCDNANCTRRP